MSTIVFIEIPAFGHVNPTLPIAQELMRRGEHVIYYNAEEFRAVIEPTGAEFRPYPTNAISANAINGAVESGNLANVPLLLFHAADALIPFLRDEFTRQRPDVVIFDSTALWGRVVASLLKIPAIGSITTFVFDTPVRGMSPRELFRLVRSVLPSVPGILSIRSRMMREYGDAFPSKRPQFPVRGELNLLFTARDLQPLMPLIDETLRFVGPSLNAQTRSDDFVLDKAGDGPLVYISLGTVHTGHVEFYRACFDAFGHDPARFVLSVGKNTDIDALGVIPDNFTVRPTVPQLQVLEQADVFITHAGINSVHEGLYFGVPLILIPQQAEQLINAVVVERQGAGVVLRDVMRGREVTVEELQDALNSIRTQSGYREAAARLQKSLRATGGYTYAADEIQQFVATQGKAS